MEFAGVGLRAYDLALVLQMLMFNLLQKLVSHRRDHKEQGSKSSVKQEKKRDQNEVYQEEKCSLAQQELKSCGLNLQEKEEEEDEVEKQRGKCSVEMGKLDQGVAIQGRAMHCALQGYSDGVQDCQEMNACDPVFIDQVCSLIACELMWT